MRCVVNSLDDVEEFESYKAYELGLACHCRVIGDSVKSASEDFQLQTVYTFQTEHVFIFDISFPLIFNGRKIMLKFFGGYARIIECGVQILMDETDGSNKGLFENVEWRTYKSYEEAVEKEEYQWDTNQSEEEEEDDLWDTHESNEAFDKEDHDYESAPTAYEDICLNPSPKLDPIPNPTASSSRPLSRFTFPDSAAAFATPRIDDEASNKDDNEEGDKSEIVSEDKDEDTAHDGDYQSISSKLLHMLSLCVN